MLDYIKTITQTMKSFGFDILDYAKDEGKTINKAAITYFKSHNPDVAISDELIVDIMKYVNCVYQERLIKETTWSDTSLIYHGDTISCQLGELYLTAVVIITPEEIRVKSDERCEIVAGGQSADKLLINTSFGTFLSQEGAEKVKDAILRLLLGTQSL